MPFLIRSADRRTTICTASAETAARHLDELQRDGIEATVSDLNGQEYGLEGLWERAEAAKLTAVNIRKRA